MAGFACGCLCGMKMGSPELKGERRKYKKSARGGEQVAADRHCVCAATGCLAGFVMDSDSLEPRLLQAMEGTWNVSISLAFIMRRPGAQHGSLLGRAFGATR